MQNDLQASQDGNEVIVFGNNHGYHNFYPGFGIYGSSDDRGDLGGTLIVFGGSTNHSLGIFFRGHALIKIQMESKHTFLFFDGFGKKLLLLNLGMIDGIGGLRRLTNAEGTLRWSCRLMYDYEKHFVKGCTYYGDMGAIAIPFEDDKRNGMEVPQFFMDLLFKKYE